MRTLNLKAAVILLIAIIVVAGSTHLLHSFQERRHSRTFYAAAKDAWDATPRRGDEALQFLKDYVALNQKDYDARKELGFWLAETGRLTASTTVLEELARTLEKQNPPNKQLLREVRQELVQVNMEGLRNWASAEDHLTAILQDYPLDHPEQIDAVGAALLWRLGECQRKQTHDELACESYRKALANPKNRCNFVIYRDWAMTLQLSPVTRVQNPKEAQKVMDEMIAIEENAKSDEAHAVYSQWLQEFGSKSNPKATLQEALRHAEIAVQLKSDSPQGLYLAANCEMMLQDFVPPKERTYAKAEEYAIRGLKAASEKEKIKLYLKLAEIYSRTDRRDATIAILKQGIAELKSTSDKSDLLWRLANIYLDGHNDVVDEASLAAAKDCIRQLSEYRFSSDQLELLEARVLYANQDWESARKRFEQVRSKMAEFPPVMACLNYWIGYCYVQQGNPDSAELAFHRALNFDKSRTQAPERIAQISMSNARYQDAMSEYLAIAAANPDNQDAWINYARAALLKTLQVKDEKRDWPAFVEAWTKAKNHTKGGQIDLYLVEALLAHGQGDRAEEILAELHKGSPNSPAAYVGLANLYAGRGESAKASQMIDDAYAKLGDSPNLRLARASLALRERGERAGPEIDKLARNMDAFSADERIEILGGLMNSMADIKDYARAKAFGRQIAAMQPHDATIRYRLMEFVLQSHNFREPEDSLAEMDRLLSEIEKIAGKGPLWHYGKAVRLRLEAGSSTNKDYNDKLLQDAMEHAKEAQRQRQGWSRPNVLMGEIRRLQGKDDEALQHYLDASVNGDRDPEFNRTLLQMLNERQRYQEAEQVLKRLESSAVGVTPDLAQFELDVSLVYYDFDRAKKAAYRFYDPSAGDYYEHLKHGQALRMLARRARTEGHQAELPKIVADAEKSLRKAIEIAHAAPAPHVELILLLVDAKEQAKVQLAAADAEEMMAREVAPLALGYIYEALGKPEKAAESYELAIKRQPDRPLPVRTLAEFYLRNRDVQRAAPLVEKLLSGQFTQNESELQIARRMQAELWIQQGKRKQALKLIEQNMASPLASAQDKRILAGLMLAEKPDAPETLRLLEDLVKKGAAEPDPQDRYNLACLYLRLGKWDPCHEQMEKLVNAGQCEPRYLAAYVKMDLDRRLLDDAALWLDAYEKVAKPGEAAALRAELMFLRKDWGALTPFLAQYLDNPAAVPENRNQRLLKVAQLLEDFGRRLTAPTERAVAAEFVAEAGKRLEEYAKSGPSGEMTLAAFYARHGKLPAAIDLLERFAGQASPQDLAVAAVAVVSCEKVAPPQLQQVEKILTAAVDRQRHVLLLTVLGALKITQGNAAAAEVFYRDVLAADPNNIMACNNLAVLLALPPNDPKRLDEALELINHAIELAGPQPKLIDSRAVVRIARGEPQRAIEELEPILANPAEKIDPVWLFHKAWALKKAGDLPQARDVLRKASLEPHNLDRSQIDPPERAIYDELKEEIRNLPD